MAFADNLRQLPAITHIAALHLLDDSGELILLKVVQEDGEEFLEPIEDDEEFDRVGCLFGMFCKSARESKDFELDKTYFIYRRK
mgnify:CR=1 FL=1